MPRSLPATSRDPYLTLRRVERQQLLIEILSAASSELTSEQLATRLRVTTRTVERDLRRLRESGVPITARPGPAGGSRLLGAGGHRVVSLTVAEIAALLASLAALGPTATGAAASATESLVVALAGDGPPRPAGATPTSRLSRHGRG